MGTAARRRWGVLLAVHARLRPLGAWMEAVMGRRTWDMVDLLELFLHWGPAGLRCRCRSATVWDWIGNGPEIFGPGGRRRYLSRWCRW